MEIFNEYPFNALEMRGLLSVLPEKQDRSQIHDLTD